MQSVADVPCLVFIIVVSEGREGVRLRVEGPYVCLRVVIGRDTFSGPEVLTGVEPVNPVILPLPRSPSS